MYRRKGFVKEGIQREAHLVEDKWHDVISLGILEKEYMSRSLTMPAHMSKTKLESH